MAARLHGCKAAWLQGCMAARLQGCTAARLQGCTAAGLQSCKAAWLSELELLQVAALLVQLSCPSCIAAPAMAAMPLKSWKGCIAELMAQPNFRVSLLRTMDFGAGNGVWD